jgi:hypothetical protein
VHTDGTADRVVYWVVRRVEVVEVRQVPQRLQAPYSSVMSNNHVMLAIVRLIRSLKAVLVHEYREDASRPEALLMA